MENISINASLPNSPWSGWWWGYMQGNPGKMRLLQHPGMEDALGPMLQTAQGRFRRMWVLHNATVLNIQTHTATPERHLLVHILFFPLHLSLFNPSQAFRTWLTTLTAPLRFCAVRINSAISNHYKHGIPHFGMSCRQSLSSFSSLEAALPCCGAQQCWTVPHSHDFAGAWSEFQWERETLLTGSSHCFPQFTTNALAAGFSFCGKYLFWSHRPFPELCICIFHSYCVFLKSRIHITQHYLFPKPENMNLLWISLSL